MTIWIDLENSPHVPFFLPIIRELRSRNIEVILTARDFAQTKQLVLDANLDATIIGEEAGDNRLRKSAALLVRAVKLAWHLRGMKIDLAVAHGSRGLLLASKMLLVRSMILYDYEGANVGIFNKLASHVMTPAVIPQSKLALLGLPPERSLRYSGLKEEVYVTEFVPDVSFARSHGLEAEKITISVRPPSHTAHYKSDASFSLFEAIMLKLSHREDVRVLISPRTTAQSDEIKGATFFNPARMIVLDRAVNGLDLLYHSDLVIGGGGTMNREAAVLGVPVVSIFKGESGAVDESLEREGKLYSIQTADEIVSFIRKRAVSQSSVRSSRVREEIISAIVRLASREISA